MDSYYKVIGTLGNLCFVLFPSILETFQTFDFYWGSLQGHCFAILDNYSKHFLSNWKTELLLFFVLRLTNNFQSCRDGATSSLVLPVLLEVQITLVF